MTAPERRYAFVRVRAGDYLLPSNSGRWLWRIARDEGEGWSLWMFEGNWRTDESWRDADDWSCWGLDEAGLPTRQACANSALAIEATWLESGR